jgi:hypothetical protein
MDAHNDAERKEREEGGKEVVLELEERGLCRQRQQSMDDDNGNTQQSNSTREKGEEDGTNGRTNDRTNERMNERTNEWMNE